MLGEKHRTRKHGVRGENHIMELDDITGTVVNAAMNKVGAG